MPRIELKVTHTHAGAIYRAGHVIEVEDHAARWLIERGIGVIAAPQRATDEKAARPVQPAFRTRSAKE